MSRIYQWPDSVLPGFLFHQKQCQSKILVCLFFCSCEAHFSLGRSGKISKERWDFSSVWGRERHEQGCRVQGIIRAVGWSVDGPRWGKGRLCDLSLRRGLTVKTVKVKGEFQGNTDSCGLDILSLQ